VDLCTFPEYVFGTLVFSSFQLKTTIERIATGPAFWHYIVERFVFALK
jgi:hypothetical protein